uniref:plasmid hypothetical protein 3 n=1 Tax=Moniliophthora perniciosa TaxID=153609 RepID=UPI0000242372|nr:plasmid hypothetical protein 3 [Moniliophthora perniciosa]AAQ74290.1 plasmid hypothetical protein 3 [Moniliophthora perniciosa]
MNRFIGYIRDNFGKGLFATIALDGYRRQLEESHFQKLLEQAKSDKKKAEKLLEEKDKALEASAKSDSDFNTKMTSSKLRYEEADDKYKAEVSNLDNVKSKIENKHLEPGETMEMLESKRARLTSSVEKLSEIREKQVQELLTNIKEFTEKKSFIFSFFNDLWENYSKFIDTLTLDQIVIIFNLIGYSMVFSTLTNLVILIIGDKIIENFNLDIKFPKIARFIKVRKELNKKLLNFYILSFYVLILLLVLANLYMFFLKYTF